VCVVIQPAPAPLPERPDEIAAAVVAFLAP
jgi:hypothetical protein